MASIIPSLHDAEWLKRPQTQAVFQALNQDGHTARAVGGAVRNALLGEPVADIDIATTAKPEETTRLAEEAGLKVIATGLSHGTVTIIADHTPFEVTTLREDLETFGRHATVGFTSDWAADARRRDFTINALYCDSSGTVFDPLEGYKDLQDRRVRFIGNATQRIQEDYLRILRFFRFSSQYGNGTLDQPGMAACLENREGLQQLSKERIRAELLRLLATPYATTVVPAVTIDILSLVLPSDPDIATFEHIVAVEDANDLPPDPIRRLAALSAAAAGTTDKLKAALRLSSIEEDRLARMTLPDPALNPSSDPQQAKIFIYRYGNEAFVDALVLNWARSGTAATEPDFKRKLTFAQRWNAPELPVRGADLLDLGVPPGPMIGKLLHEFEDWWISANFPDDAGLLASKLSELSSPVIGRK